MTTPLITKLSFPAIIDVSNGATRQDFSVELAPGKLGDGVDVYLEFDYLPLELNIGKDGVVNDGFDDGTPYYGSSSYNFDGGSPAGTYTIRALTILDGQLLGERYTTADLKAMNLPFAYTVIDRNAPAAPTMTVAAAANGLVDGVRATVSGTSGAYQEISVTYLDKYEVTWEMGKVKADAQGHWSLTSEQLFDGHYTQVVATATDPVTGKTSATRSSYWRTRCCTCWASRRTRHPRSRRTPMWSAAMSISTATVPALSTATTSNCRPITLTSLPSTT